MSIFSKGKQLSRREFRETLRKSSSVIPGSGGRMYSRQERVKMEKEVFPMAKFKTHISEIEVKKRLRELGTEKLRSKSGAEKLKIDRKIRFLQDITGVKPH